MIQERTEIVCVLVKNVTNNRVLQQIKKKYRASALSHHRTEYVVLSSLVLFYKVDCQKSSVLNVVFLFCGIKY